MKFNILKPVLAAIVLLLGLSSCSDDNWSLDDKMPKGQGQASLNDFGITLKDISLVTPTRAGEDVSEFIIDILRASNRSVVKSYTYKNVPEIITLEQGDYIAKAYSHNMQPTEWDHPYYEGEQEFRIEAGKVTPIGTITCSFASIKVTIEYSKELLELMADDCLIDVDYNNGTVLTFTPQEKRAGYFKPVENGTTMVAKLTGTINSQSEKFTLPLKDVAPGQWRLIRLDAQNADTSQSNLIGGATHIDGSSGTSGITIECTVTDIKLEGGINIDEEVIKPTRPGQEENLPTDPGTNPGTNPGTDPGTDPNTPSGEVIRFVTNPGFDANAVNEVDPEDDSKQYIVNIYSDNGFAHLEVTIDSETLTPEELDGVGLTSKFDLAYPGVYEDKLKNFGFATGADVIGKKEVTFEISPFIPLLALLGPGNSDFILKVTDTEGEQNSITLRFVVK